MSKLFCPGCKSISRAEIYDSRNVTLESGLVAVIRRRRCDTCGAHYKTVEVVEADLLDYAFKTLEERANVAKEKAARHKSEHERGLQSAIQSAIADYDAKRRHMPGLSGSGGEGEDSMQDMPRDRDEG